MAMKPEGVGREPGFISKVRPATANRAALSSLYCSTVPIIFLWYIRLPLGSVSDQRNCQTAEPRLRLIRSRHPRCILVLPSAVAVQEHFRMAPVKRGR